MFPISFVSSYISSIIFSFRFELIKNIGSISSVGRAIEREAIRQEELIENGESVVFATYRYDEKEDKTEY